MNQSKRNYFKFRKSPIKKTNSNQNNIDLEAENERNKDAIIKLKEQIVAKDKEISDLKVSKLRNEEQFKKTLKIFDEIVKESDKSTVQGMKEIERNLSNNFNKNKRNFSKNNNNNINKYKTIGNNKITNYIGENNNNNYQNNNINHNHIENEDDENDNNENNEDIKPKIHLKKSQRKKLNDLLNNHSLKLKVIQQNNLLLKKEKEIEKLKLDTKSSTFSKMKNNYVQNYKELKSIQKENETLSNQNFDIINYCNSLEEKNKELIFKLESFKQDFKSYKESQNEKIKKLEDELEKYQSKERDCKMFHKRKGKLDDLNNNNHLNEIENEMKKMSKTMTFLKKEKNSQDDEIKTLNLKLKNLNEENNKLNKQVNELNINIKNNNEKEKMLIKIRDESKNKIDNLDNQIKEEKKNNELLKEKINNLDKENKNLKISFKEL